MEEQTPQQDPQQQRPYEGEERRQRSDGEYKGDERRKAGTMGDQEPDQSSQPKDAEPDPESTQH
jgi:hypothetical protein